MRKYIINKRSYSDNDMDNMDIEALTNLAYISSKETAEIVKTTSKFVSVINKLLMVCLAIAVISFLFLMYHKIYG